MDTNELFFRLQQEGIPIIGTTEMGEVIVINYKPEATDAQIERGNEILAELFPNNITPDPIKTFNLNQVIERLNQALSLDRIDALAGKWAVLRDLLQWKNFQKLKMYMFYLIQIGIATQDDYDKLSSVLAEQGINLGDY